MKNPYPINPLLKYVVKAWMFFFTKKHNITANISPDLVNIDEPYLLLSNHYGRYDPFIISYWFKKRPNFISSDAILRDRIIGTLFKGLGAMPKKKGVRDSYIIREMVKVINAGGALALFPEGTRTWDGQTSFMDPSIAKLVRLLKVPVITARMKGAYLMDPRWAIPVRKAKMEIDYALVIHKDEFSTLSEGDIFDRVWEGIYQDDIKYQQKERIKIRSDHRAENIELVIWCCPKCLNMSGFQSAHNNFSCKKCKSGYKLDAFGFIETMDESEPEFDNVRDWIGWQNDNFVAFMQRKFKEFDSGEFFAAENMIIECAEGKGRMQNLGTGSIHFYRDRIEVKLNGARTSLKLDEISSLGAQFKERIELFYHDYAYRFTSSSASESGLKWELATNVVWSLSGDNRKVASYFADLLKV
jgi:1-acyl-sn-glycerol-3-phosphate acyltransferase